MPALSNYLSVMETLQQIFKQMEMEAGNISEDANQFKQGDRAFLMFRTMKGAAKRVTESSKGLLGFYETVHSRLLAM